MMLALALTGVPFGRSPDAQPIPDAPPPPITAGMVINSASYGVPIDDRSDSSAPLQAIVDALPVWANATITVGPGQHFLNRPVVFNKHNLTVSGAGWDLTSFVQPF